MPCFWQTRTVRPNGHAEIQIGDVTNVLVDGVMREPVKWIAAMGAFVIKGILLRFLFKIVACVCPSADQRVEHWNSNAVWSS